uniref:Uncharacterized protein n=1 Tax=Aegilops tauschii subsp. strangulata TaxID=200361 RepID=A0A453E7V9_AEGTS
MNASCHHSSWSTLCPRHAKLWIVCKLPFAFVRPMSVIFATKPIVLCAFYVRTLLGGSLLCSYKQTLLLNDSSLVFLFLSWL